MPEWYEIGPVGWVYQLCLQQAQVCAILTGVENVRAHFLIGSNVVMSLEIVLSFYSIIYVATIKAYIDGFSGLRYYHLGFISLQKHI